MAWFLNQSPTTFERLSEEKKRLQIRLSQVGPGRARDKLLDKIRRLDTAALINEWLSSARLRAPVETSVKIALLLTVFVVAAEGSPVAVPNEMPSIREQLKADRAKAKTDEENASKARFWDRDADGKRPWDRPKEPPLTKE